MDRIRVGISKLVGSDREKETYGDQLNCPNDRCLSLIRLLCQKDWIACRTSL